MFRNHVYHVVHAKRCGSITSVAELFRALLGLHHAYGKFATRFRTVTRGTPRRKPDSGKWATPCRG